MTSPQDLPDERRRIGLVATDPLRIIGLQSILADDESLEFVALSVPGNSDLDGFSLVIIDSGCTEHLFELLAGFRQRYPRLKIIVMGMEPEHSFIERVIGAGAKGYLTHFAKEREIRMALEIVLDGSMWAPRKVLASLIDSAGPVMAKKSVDEVPKITAREAEVLGLLVAGRPNREIARELRIDEGTVKAHVGRLMRKMGVENRIALTMRVVGRNMLGGEGTPEPNSN
jgi:DNA-binding NarL/FixJ family response regulator